MASRLEEQLNFIFEIDKLKTVLRKSFIIDASRLENTAEHSWHFAMMAMILLEHAPHPNLNLLHTIKMALIHDLVEIDAGDTYCYDEGAHNDKEEREIAAAKRIFGLLPHDQDGEIWKLWREFEEGKTPESKYARSLDRLNPFFLNFKSGGGSWKQHGIKKSQILKRMGEVEYNLPKLWPEVLSMIEEGLAHGWIKNA